MSAIGTATNLLGKNFATLAATGNGSLTQTLRGLGSQFSILTQQQILSLATTAKMPVNYLKAAVAMSSLTTAEKAEIIAAYEQVAATQAQATATAGAAGATASFKTVMVGLGAVMEAHPLMALLTTVTLVYGAFKLASWWSDRFKRSLSDLKDEYQDLKSDAEGLQSEYDSNLSTLQELEKIEAPTLADEAEIKRLKEANEQLAIQIRYKQTLADEREKDAAQTFAKAYQSEMTGWQNRTTDIVSDEQGNTTTVSRTQQEQLDYDLDRAKKFKELAQETTDAVSQSNYEAWANQYLDAADQIISAQEELADGVTYGLDDDADASINAIKDARHQWLLLKDAAGSTQIVLESIFADARFAGDGGAVDSIKNVVSEYGNAIAEYDDIVQEAKDKGVDLERAVYGNIDTDSRQILEWTEASVEKFRDALTSWNINPDDMLGSYSTVLGSWDEYDGVPIAFSPILQTDNGPQVLSADTVDKYISTLLKKVKQNGDWTTEDLLRLDTQGLEVDGIKIKNIIADVGNTAEQTAESMHFSGATGALAEAKQRMEELKTKIHELYATNPQVKELIDTLIRLGLFSWDNLDGLVNQLNDVADAADDVTEAVSAWADLSQSTDKLVSATETLRDAQKELKKGYLSSGTLKSMQENIAGMDEIIVKYKLGMVTAQQVYAEYKRLYEADKANFKSQNALKLGLTEEFFNKSVKGNANYTKILGTYYTSDLGNFKELAQKKLEIDTQLQKTLGENWADYFSTYAQAVTASSFNLMSEAEYNKKYPHGDYAAYQLINVSENRVSSAQLSQYKELLAIANKFDDFAKQVNSDLNIKIPQLSGGSSSSGSSQSTTETKKSMDEVYADLKSLQEETERQNDRLSNMTQDTTAEQISLWYNLRKEAIKQLNKITDHTSEAYRYVEDIVKDCNSNISSLYDDQLDALDKIIDMTEDMLKKEADDQVDALEDQVDKYKEIVELKKKLLEQSSDEEDYEKKVAKLTKEIADIQESIGQLDLEIKSNPNDSRKAQAEQQKLLQDLAAKQDELSELQRQHWKDSLTDRLDDEADAFEKSKQEEIDKIKDTVDDDKKLHEKAIDYIDKNWDDLYNQLSKYAKEQGRDVEKELTKAWDIAKDAVDAYGGSILDAMDNIEKMQSMIQSTTKEGNYNQVGELAGNPQLMAIVKMMKQNSMDYLATSDTNVKQSIKANQADLKSQFEQISGRQLKQGSDGTWYLDKVGGETLYSHFGVGDVQNPYRQNSSSSSSSGTRNSYTKPSSKTILKSGSSGSGVGWVQTQLNKAAAKEGNSAFKVTVDSKYGAKTTAAVRAFQRAMGLSVDGQVGPNTLKYLEKYHTGGIVGGNATLKDNEMLAVLEKKETVLTNSMWKNLTEKLNAVQDFIQSSLPVIDKFPAGAVPAYAGAGGMNIAPVINVQFEHHGDFDEKAAKKFASQISDFTIQQIKKNQQTHRYRK